MDCFDDAGVYRLDEATGIVLTLDFFPPLVDDPYIFGQIAAANALSDVYAMGGTPLAVLNIVGFPDKELPIEILGDILRGGAERVAAAGAVVAGGHSVRDAEIKFGLSVTGRVDPNRILTNAGAQPGDVLILTKPIGTAQLTTAAKQGKIPQTDLREAIDSMIELNKGACEAIHQLAKEFGTESLPKKSDSPEGAEPQASACATPGKSLSPIKPISNGGVNAVTDITGFGLLGHALEIAQASNVTIEINANRVPLMNRALELAKDGVLTRAHKSNLEAIADKLDATGVDETLVNVLADAQTSGGLLIAVAQDKADQLVELLKKNQTRAAVVIGKVNERQEAAMALRAD